MRKIEQRNSYLEMVRKKKGTKKQWVKKKSLIGEKKKSFSPKVKVLQKDYKSLYEDQKKMNEELSLSLNKVCQQLEFLQQQVQTLMQTQSQPKIQSQTIVTPPIQNINSNPFPVQTPSVYGHINPKNFMAMLNLPSVSPNLTIPQGLDRNFTSLFLPNNTNNNPLFYQHHE